MPDLALLPPHTRVFVDTNIFDLHYRGKSATCTAFIDRVARGDVVAYVNTQVLSDLLHKLMLAEAYAKGLITGRQASRLKGCLKNQSGVGNQIDRLPDPICEHARRRPESAAHSQEDID